MWPAISVDPISGAVDVTYYEMEDRNVTPDANDIECSVRTGGTLTNPTLRHEYADHLLGTTTASSRAMVAQRGRRQSS